MRYVAAFLELSSPGTGQVKRWQSRWRHTVTLAGQQWEPVAFDWSGIVAGGSAEDAGTDLSFPRLPSIEQVLRLAQAEVWRGTLWAYHYAEGVDDTEPPEDDLVLVGFFRGVLEVSGGSGPPGPALKALLSPAQSAYRFQFPPRLADTALIGGPCVLS